MEDAVDNFFDPDAKKQFQLDQFLDHLTVIIKRHAVTLNLQSRSKVG